MKVLVKSLTKIREIVERGKNKATHEISPNKVPNINLILDILLFKRFSTPKRRIRSKKKFNVKITSIYTFIFSHQINYKKKENINMSSFGTTLSFSRKFL